MVSEQFPEVTDAASQWPSSYVVDGELIAWNFEKDLPAPFSDMQKRLGRKTVSKKVLKEVPVVFIAYDMLELQGIDLRQRPFEERQRLLHAWAESFDSKQLRLSTPIHGTSWADYKAIREEARALRVEGLMLKRRNSTYQAGRKKGEWWKWKVAPYTIDAVLVYAQQGHGRRAGLYTDYTFAVWIDDQLVPFAKAYSGLTDKEIRRVDRWIRQHTISSHGPVRVVEPLQVFEIAFEGINESKRHKSGIAVRFPRILRWREDKPAKEADSLETVRSLLDVD